MAVGSQQQALLGPVRRHCHGVGWPLPPEGERRPRGTDQEAVAHDHNLLLPLHSRVHKQAAEQVSQGARHCHLHEQWQRGQRHGHVHLASVHRQVRHHLVAKRLPRHVSLHHGPD